MSQLILVLVGTQRMLRGAKLFGNRSHSSWNLGHLARMQGPWNAPRRCSGPPMPYGDAETLQCPTGMQRPSNASTLVGMQRPGNAPQGCRDSGMRDRNSTAQPLRLPGRGMGTRPARSSRRLRTQACSLRPLHAPAGRLGVGVACGSGGPSSCGRREPPGSAAPTDREGREPSRCRPAPQAEGM